MKKIKIFYSVLPVVILSTMIFLQSCKPKTNEVKVEISNVKKEDLSKIGWIEGDWQSIYRNEPFYESYKLIDDSTLLIMSYIYTGTDSSSYSNNYLHWKDGAYFLGAALNYKVVEMDDKRIKMLQHGQATNDILWQHVDDNTWTALLTSTADTILYTMSRSSIVDSIRAASRNDTLRPE